MHIFSHHQYAVVIYVAATIDCARDIISSEITSRTLNSSIYIKEKAPWGVRFLEVADRGSLIKLDTNEDDESKNTIDVLKHKIKFLETINATLLLKCGASIQNVKLAGEHMKAIQDVSDVGVTTRSTLDMMTKSSLVWKQVKLEDDDAIGLTPSEQEDIDEEKKAA